MNEQTREFLNVLPQAVAAIGGFVALFWVVLKFYRWAERRAARKLRSIYEEAGLPTKAGPGDVSIRFHTYHGLLVWQTETEHRLALPPAKARLVLKRLHRFNVTSGMLSKHLFFVPCVSLANYLIQLRRIRAQERLLEQQGIVWPPDEPAPRGEPDRPGRQAATGG
jgi:hypothetical protein